VIEDKKYWSFGPEQKGLILIIKSKMCFLVLLWAGLLLSLTLGCKPSCPIRKGEGGWRQQLAERPDSLTSKQLRQMKKKGGDLHIGWAAAHKRSSEFRRRLPNSTMSAEESDGEREADAVDSGEAEYFVELEDYTGRKDEDGGSSGEHLQAGAALPNQGISTRGGFIAKTKASEKGDLGGLHQSQLDEIETCEPTPISASDSGTDATEDTELDSDGGLGRQSQLSRQRQATYAAQRMKEVSQMAEPTLEDQELQNILQAILSANTTVELLYEAGGIPGILHSADAFLRLTEEDVLVSDAILAAEAVLKLAKCCQEEELSCENLSSQTRVQQLLEILSAQAARLPLHSVVQTLLALASLHLNGATFLLRLEAPKPAAIAMADLLSTLALRTVQLLPEALTLDQADIAYAWATVFKLIMDTRSNELEYAVPASVAEAFDQVASALLDPWVGKIESSSRIWGLDSNQLANLAWAAVILHLQYPSKIGHQSQDLVYELAKEAYARYRDATQETFTTPNNSESENDGEFPQTLDKGYAPAPAESETCSENEQQEEHEVGNAVPVPQENELHLRVVGGRGICILAWACEIFGIHDQHFYTMAMLEAGKWIDAVGSSDLSNFAWGLAGAGFYDQYLGDKILQVAEERFDELSPESLGKLSRAFGAWSHQNADSFVARALAEVQGSRDFMDGNWQEGLHFRPKDYIGVASAFAKLVKNPDSKLQKWSILMGRLWVILEKQMESLPPSQFVDMIWTYSTLDLHDETASHKICGFLGQENDFLEILAPADLTRVIWSIGRSQGLTERSHALLAKLHAAVVSRAEEYTPRDIIIVFTSLLGMGFKECYPHLLSFDERQLSQLNPSSLSNLLWILAVLKIEDEAIVSLVVQDIEPKILSFSPQDLSRTLWALANLPDCHAPLVENLFPALLTQILKDVKLLSPKDLATVLSSTEGILGVPGLVEFVDNSNVSELLEELSRHTNDNRETNQQSFSRLSAFNLGKCIQIAKQRSTQ